MDSSPRKVLKTVSPVAGVKRSAQVPSLLPAFEPFSSSPPLPMPTKRVARDFSANESPSKNKSSSWHNEISKYPTPVPTSSTGILTSSPPHVPLTRRRPYLERTVSALSERAPLASVPSIELDADGEEVLLGRGKKNAYRFSSDNNLISRVHVRAAYVPANPPQAAKVELVCKGWNGLRVHCQGKAWELGKDDTFTSEAQDADIMVDVQDSRVLLQWPKAPRRITTPAESDSGPEFEDSPTRAANARVNRVQNLSPLRHRARLQSPISPSNAANLSTSLFSSSAPAMIQIYEDSASEEEPEKPKASTQPTQSTQRLTQPLGASLELPRANDENELSDQDEENDPVIHSFGPFGDNLLPRMASFTAGASPLKRRSDPASDATPARESTQNRKSQYQEMSEALTDHIINQLAYSRLSSIPLSDILQDLPTAAKQGTADYMRGKQLSSDHLKSLLNDAVCIGEVPRAGKDAAGKPLESEYYYIHADDPDENRRQIVNGLQKPSLRNCRKQHKQYYWRKPK